MAFDGVRYMTNEELIDWEARIRHASHAVDRKKKKLDAELEAFALALATSRGIPKEQRSGGHGDKPDQPPEG